MSYRLDYNPAAINAAAGLMADDPVGVRTVMDAIDRLPEDPAPAEATALGATGLYRLRVGPYRVMYRVDGDVITIGLIGRKA